MKKVRFDNNQIPLHYQISDYILDMLKRGELKPDKKLPPEEELKDVFGVSRTTIRHSLDHLLNKGLLVRKQGKGTFWTESAYAVRKEKLSGINRQIFNITEKTRVEVLSKSSEKPSPDISEFLKLSEKEKVIVFKRLRYIGREPMSYTVNFLPESYGGPIEKKHLRGMTMLETLEKVDRINLGIIEHIVEITRANNEISDHLGIAVLDPVLTVQTSVFDKNSEPVEIVWTYFVENKYKFRVILD